jgi:hypothetical protein
LFFILIFNDVTMTEVNNEGKKSNKGIIPGYSAVTVLTTWGARLGDASLFPEL